MVRVLPLRSLLLGAGLVALGGCQTKHHVGKKVPERPAPAPALSPRPLPQGAFDGSKGSLLDEYAKRRERPAGPKNPKDTEEYIPTEEEVRGFTLPNNSKKIVTSLLTWAAQDNLTRAAALFSQQARWGIPDRREPEARLILGDGGAKFFDIFRDVASRFEAKETLTCPPIMPAATVYVRNGAEPMWCFYISNDNLDILAFKFIQEGGTAKIDYVGFHEVRPNGQIQRPGPLPPPMTPNLRRASRLPPGFDRGSLQPGQPGEAGQGPLAPDQLQPGQLQPGQPQPGQPQPGQPLGGPSQPVAVPGQPGQPAAAPAPTKAGQPAAPTKAGQPTAPTKTGQPAAPQPARPKPPAKAPTDAPAKAPAASAKATAEPTPAKAPAAPAVRDDRVEPAPAKAPAAPAVRDDRVEPAPAKAPPAP